MTFKSPIKLTGQKSFCTACGELFNSVCAFDRHRCGRFGHDRRCRSVTEMRERGMERNAKGFWTTGARPGFPQRVAA